MSGSKPRQFSREFKLAALSRMAAGENVSALARELGVRRKYLYEWRERFRLGGAEALWPCGRPPKAAALLRQHAISVLSDRSQSPETQLERARQEIAALQRKVGEQQVALDFFQRALQRLNELNRESEAPGNVPSTKSSKI